MQPNHRQTAPPPSATNARPPRKVPLFALVGNPNCGKTSLFNALTGSHQHVGNWGGVTVEVKEGTAQLDGKTCTFVDLPGTYSLSAYSFEERVVSDVLLKERPDAVINVVDATNLERNLYLTVQLFELGIRPVLVLNMWDEVQQKGIAIDLLRLAELLDVPVVTTIGKNGTNIRTILEAGFTMVDSGSQNYLRHGASFPPEIESALDRIARFDALASIDAPRRWTALKLLEGDRRIADAIGSDTAEIKTAVAAAAAEIQSLLGEDPQNLIAEARYGFIAGALREAVRKQQPNRVEHSELIDGFLTHPVWAFPIFFFFMWLLFQATFVVGEYPRRLLETIITLLSQATTYLLPDTLLRSLIDEGIIHGVGGVIVFLPNILILFFGIAIMEDTGYMARAAFITDKIMHKVGLHGKSFIPILMGLGCNVPAIMAARTLESITERRKTILLTPLISCSARLPVYVLFAGALFPKHAGNIVFLFQFVFGTITFFILAYIFKKTLFRGEEHPFVMELPPYRLPTLRSILIHMWLNAGHFLKKMGGVVLVFSIVIWVLGHFPVNNNIAASYTQKIEAVRQNTRLTSAEQTSRIATLQSELKSEQIRYSSIGRIGTAIAPIFKPLGFEWREAVSLLTGFVAKEIVVSSMGVLYAGGGDSSTDSNLITEIRRHFTPLKGFAFMLFVLLYTPCIVAMVTAMRELHSIRWSIFSVMYQLVLAWVAAFAVYQGGRLIGLE